MARNPLPKTEELAKRVIAGDRILLSRAITLIESSHPDHQQIAADLLEFLLPHTGKSMRLGITGAPGVGKSTFIEAFGKMVADSSQKVAVLPVDPSSSISAGSILGDKTRMQELSNHPNAYIRPSPAGDSLGGVTRKTRETILLCEAAGFDLIIVETVGVGQSETVVRDMVDFFLLLALAGGGDDLQGIKRGIMEMADAIAINKADGDNINRCKLAAKFYEQAIHLFPPLESGWTVPVLTCSALEGNGLADLMQNLKAFEEHTKASGFFQENRSRQEIKWFRSSYRNLLDHYLANKINNQILISLEEQIRQGSLTVRTALAALQKELAGVW